MELYIGGCAQGKLNYVLRQYEDPQNCSVWECRTESSGEKIKAYLQQGKKTEPVIINHFHCLVKEMLLTGENPEELVQRILECYPACIIISDEIGNGIVPIAKDERAYREQTGRILIALAEKAERVERILCGLGQRLK